MQNQTPPKIQRESSKNKSHSILPNQSTQQKFNQYAYLTSSLLQDLIQQQQQQYFYQTPFDSQILKHVNLKTYIQNLHRQTNYQPQCLIIALIYIDRYNLNNNEFILTWSNVHKLLLVCILLATKFHDQVYYDNKAFEIGGGVNNVKLVELETKVFQMLDFNLFVDDQYFFQFLNSIYNAYMIKQLTEMQKLQQQQDYEPKQ